MMMSETWERLRLLLDGRAVLGIPLSRWAIYLGAVVVLAVVLRGVLEAVRGRLRRHAGRTGHPFDDYLRRIVDRTWPISVLAFACLLGLTMVDLRGEPGRADAVA